MVYTIQHLGASIDEPSRCLLVVSGVNCPRLGVRVEEACNKLFSLAAGGGAQKIRGITVFLYPPPPRGGTARKKISHPYV